MPTIETRRPKRPVQLTVVPSKADLVASLLFLLATVWAFRRELLVTAVLVAVDHYAARLIDRPASTVLATLLLVTVLVVPQTRHLLCGWLSGGQVRRAWGRACRNAGLVTLNDRVPAIDKLRRVPSGDRLTLRIPDGLTAPQVEKAAEALAVCLSAAEVRIEWDRMNAARVHAVVVRCDPLAAPTGPWSNLAAPVLSLR